MKFAAALGNVQGNGFAMTRMAWPLGKEMVMGENGYPVIRDDHGSRYWGDALCMDDHMADDWRRSYAPITAEMIEWTRSKCDDTLRGATHEWWKFSQRVNTPAVATTSHRHTWGVHPGSIVDRDTYAAHKCASEFAKAISGAVCGLDIESVLAHGVSDTYAFGTAKSADEDLRAAGAIKTTWFYLDDMRSDRRFAILAGTAPQDKPLQYFMNGGDTVHVWGDVTPEALERWHRATNGPGDWFNQRVTDDDLVHFGINYKLAVWVRPGTRMLVALEVK